MSPPRELGTLRRLVALLLFAGLLTVACRKHDSIAELERARGSVDRDHKESVGRFAKASEGATFVIGDAVRTGQSSRAELRLFDKSRLDLEPKTLVRFLERRPGAAGAKLDVQTGEATLEAADEAVELDMMVGSARIEARGKVRLLRNGDRTRFEVMIGGARILTGSEALELKVGEAVDIVADKSVEPVASGSPSAAPSAAAAAVPPTPASASAAPPEEASPPDDAAGGRARGPSVVDFTLGAGDSVVVHDPSPPTAVAFQLTGCSGTGVLSLDPGKRLHETVGTGRVSAEVGGGTHRYVIDCLDGSGKKGARVGQGTLSVIADAGVRQLAKTAPVTNIDADGRRYTVLYQTLLPKIAVRWPNAPAASRYTLLVVSSSGTKNQSASSPSFSFPSGALKEGEHSLTFEAGGTRSRTTSLEIRFDNAAPTASIASPADRSFAPGSSVLVSGSALPGFSVSAGGRELTQDGQNRFSEQVPAPAGERALVIRFSQAGRGVHYYLRRSAH